jgi:hypothetical protein
VGDAEVLIERWNLIRSSLNSAMTAAMSSVEPSSTTMSSQSVSVCATTEPIISRSHSD